MNEEAGKWLANPAARREKRFANQQSAEDTANQKQQPSMPTLPIHSTPLGRFKQEASIYQAASLAVKKASARALPALDRNLNFAAVPTNLKLDLGNGLAGENDAGLPAENF